MRLLAFNADQRFQLDAEQRAAEEQRPVVQMGLLARQHRFYAAAGRLLRDSGRWVLRVRDNAATAPCGPSTHLSWSTGSDAASAALWPPLRSGGKGAVRLQGQGVTRTRLVGPGRGRRSGASETRPILG